MSDPDRPDEELDRPKRRRVPNVADAMGLALPEDGAGLGVVGEELIRRSLEAEHEDTPERNLAWFNRRWLKLVRRGNRDERFVDAIESSADRELRRLQRWDAVKASWHWAIGAAVVVYGALNHFSEAAKWIIEHVPLMRAILKLVLENGS